VHLVLNVVLAAAYLGVASLWWTEPEVRDIPGASAGAPVLWAFTAVPIFLLAVAANLGLLAWTWRRRGLSAVPKPALAALVLWVGVLAIDFTRH
jgi:hypothetical protein